MTKQKLSTLNGEIEEFLRKKGAIRVGFATLETLAGGPPSTDLKYVLPKAKSAISYALLFDRKKIRDYLSKKSFIDHERDRLALNIKSVEISRALAKMLRKKGFKSTAVLSNNEYRKEIPGWQLKMPPDLSHRYIAVRSGVGSFGWSGNVGIKGIGTTILLGTVVTEAELEPTDPLPPEESFCTKCKLCIKACTASLFDKEKETTVTMGGEKFSYSERKNYVRCQYVCGGFTGLNKKGDKQWSTWSPGRFDVPEEDRKIMNIMFHAMNKYKKWPERTDGTGGYVSEAAPGLSIRLTCGICQNICWGNPEDTRKNYQLLINSGCVLQKPNGDIIVLPPDEAQKVFDSFPPEHRKLYCKK